MDLEKHAWVVDSWLKGERYAEIAKRLRRTPSAIQADIVLFCRKLGYDKQRTGRHEDDGCWPSFE